VNLEKAEWAVLRLMGIGEEGDERTDTGLSGVHMKELVVHIEV